MRIESLSNLDLPEYERRVDAWSDDFRCRCLPKWEPYFRASSSQFRDDIRWFRLGMLCQYLDLELGIKYNQAQKHATDVAYTDPSDLFLNGIIDRREGTCANMAALQVAIGWRMGWPVSLACAGSHFILRYDDGQVTWNIEATDTGRGGWSSRSDEQYIEEYRLPEKAIACGSDMRALTANEMRGVFVGLRARHYQDMARVTGSREWLLAAERDYLLARHLFPANRHLYRQAMAVSVALGDERFEREEPGHPATFGQLVWETGI